MLNELAGYFGVGAVVLQSYFVTDDVNMDDTSMYPFFALPADGHELVAILFVIKDGLHGNIRTGWRVAGVFLEKLHNYFAVNVCFGHPSL